MKNEHKRDMGSQGIWGQVIIPSQLKGVVWKNGQRLVRKVFNTPGKYFIYLADNLETEPENTFSFEGTVTLK